MWTFSLGWIKEDAILPWVACDKIARPKARGGWIIKDISSFASSLATKSGWRLISMENLWTTVVKRKYINLVPIDEWMCKPDKKSFYASTVWKATLDSFRTVEDGLA